MIAVCFGGIVDFYITANVMVWIPGFGIIEEHTRSE